MTDKQIIIDGVDVSGCGELHINQANTIICEITGYLCEDRQNCYYKQLKRKEQECETLASQLDFEVQKKECLEQECEKAKQVILQAVEDFSLEYGTPYYDRLLDDAKSLGIEVKDYE